MRIYYFCMMPMTEFLTIAVLSALLNQSPGTCTLHARRVGSGLGFFFLVQKCTILLSSNNKSAYSPSLYVDEHGEEKLFVMSLLHHRLRLSKNQGKFVRCRDRTQAATREMAQERNGIYSLLFNRQLLMIGSQRLSPSRSPWTATRCRWR